MKKIFICLISILSHNLSAQNGWILESNTHTTKDIPLAMANGRLGFITTNNPFTFKKVVLNGIFDKQSAEGVSRIAQGIIFANLEIKINGKLITPEKISNVTQQVNMKKASFTTTFDFENEATITTTLYALYNMPYCGLLDITITAKEDCAIDVENKMTVPEVLVDANSTFNILHDLEWEMPLQQTIAKTKFKNYTVASTAVFLFDDKHVLTENKANKSVGTSNKIKKGETYQFALGGSICTSAEFYDPKSESERFCIALLLKNKQDILNDHFAAWEEIWKNDIEIDGDLKAQQDVRFALFNIFSSIRKGSGLSVPPMGLTSQGYNGHVFWDMELWMFPAILAFDKQMAETMLDYRYDRLKKAMQKAEAFGYKGAMYPWESDDSGEEATPTWALTGTFEQHITADIGIACWNFYRVTKDKKWLQEKGYPMLKAISDYWASRVSKGSDGKYHINNVVGANEFQQNINDNAFTNASAITVLKYTTQAANELSIKPDSLWDVVANNINICKFDNGVTRENSTYNGDSIKQADVNLLAYPLQFYTDKEQIKKDMDYYEPRMAAEGPAMAHCVVSVIYSRLGEANKAFTSFERSYKPNQRGTFGVLSESAMSNNPYFLTGAGGMLQSVIFGFTGMEITDKGLIQNKICMPKQWKKITLKGIGNENKTIVVENK